MGESTPKALQNAAFFVVGKMFSLRGGAEHRNLKISHVQSRPLRILRECIQEQQRLF